MRSAPSSVCEQLQAAKLLAEEEGTVVIRGHPGPPCGVWKPVFASKSARGTGVP